VSVGGDQPDPSQHAGRLGDLAAQCRVMGRVMGGVVGRVVSRIRFPFRTRPWPAFRSPNHPGPPFPDGRRPV